MVTMPEGVSRGLRGLRLGTGLRLHHTSGEVDAAAARARVGSARSASRTSGTRKARLIVPLASREWHRSTQEDETSSTVVARRRPINTDRRARPS